MAPRYKGYLAFVSSKCGAALLLLLGPPCAQCCGNLAQRRRGDEGGSGAGTYAAALPGPFFSFG